MSTSRNRGINERLEAVAFGMEKLTRPQEVGHEGAPQKRSRGLIKIGDRR
jgi:hypothetical protein